MKVPVLSLRVLSETLSRPSGKQLNQSSRQIQQRCSYSHRERLVAFASRVRVLVPQKTVRASDFRPEGLGSMPEATKTLRVHAEYVLVKSLSPKVLWAESREQGTGEYFPP
ncbi:hypothetical protein TNCV_4210021 [Trichonephila clavipes]|nr:hypothetical protein TNCV_4210021 [Trichonephila clavipes]